MSSWYDTPLVLPKDVSYHLQFQLCNVSPMLFNGSSDVSGQIEGSLAISTAKREKRLLNGIIQNLLPAVGPSVKSIVLAYSSTVSSKMVGRAQTFILLLY